ncbi:MAG: hypothetical protein IT437_04330 [Phycisphaerales bacterium]|nr:hypothetical protein [Phycisphaerales bacterium]
MRMLAAICLISTPVLAAGPLNPAWVAADAEWVIHIDMEAVAGSGLGKFLAHPPKELQAKLGRVESQIGLDPIHDIRSVTVYGSRARPEEGMVIISSSPAMDTAINRVKARQSYRAAEEDGIVFHTWKADGQNHYATVRSDGADGGGRILFLADTMQRLVDGLRVVDGGAAHRPDGEPAPGSGSVLFVHSKGVPDAVREKAATTFVKFVDTLLIDAGESAGRMYAHVALTADSDEHARAVTQGAQGLLAFGRLAAQADPGLLELCNSIKLSSTGRTVTVDLSCDAAAAVRGLRREGDGRGPAAHRKDGDGGAVPGTTVEGGR